METNEMKVLRKFVKEFSPIHSTFVNELTYDELFEIVGQVYQSHLKRREYNEGRDKNN